MTDLQSGAGKRLFLSYARDVPQDDKNTYRREGEWAAWMVKAYLKGELPELDVWIDRERIEGGDKFDRVLEQAVKESNALLCVFSPRSIQESDGNTCGSRCELEVQTAHDRGRIIVPVRAGNCDPPWLTKTLHYHDLHSIVDRLPNELAPSEVALERLPEPHRSQAESILKQIAASVRSALKGKRTVRLWSATRDLRSMSELPELENAIVRNSMIGEVKRCLVGARPGQHQLLAVLGGAGVGKSIFAGQLAGSIGEKAGIQALAYHRLRRDLTTTSDALDFVRSIAAQIAQLDRTYAEALAADSDLQSAFISNETAADSLFRTGVAGVLKNRPSPSPEKQYVVVVDALDELQSSTSSADILTILNLWKEMPDWIHLVVTSQPIHSLETLFCNFTKLRLDESLEGCSQEVREFVALRTREPQIDDWLRAAKVLTGEAVDMIANKVRDNFMYAAILLDDLHKLAPSRQGLEQLPEKLVGYYRKRFEEIFKDDQSDPWQRIRPLLAVMNVSRDDLSLKTLALVTNTPEATARKSLSSIKNYLHLLPKEDDPISYRHQSIRQWLSGTDDVWGIPLEDGHQLFAQVAVSVFRKGEGSQHKRFLSDRYLLEHGVVHCGFALRKSPELAKDAVAIAAWMNKAQKRERVEPALLRLSHRLPIINRFLSARLERLRGAEEIDALRSIKGDELCPIIMTGCDDIPNLYPPLRILLEHHLASWRANCDDVLESDELLTRHAASLALSDIVRQKDEEGEPARHSAGSVTEGGNEYFDEILRLFESRDVRHLREMGNYALRFLFVSAAAREKYADLYKEFWQRLARSDEYSQPLTLWEMLVDIAADQSYEGSIRDLVDEESFWRPIWPYFENELAECDALEARKLGKPLTWDGAQRAHERHNWIFDRLPELKNRFENKDALLKPLEVYWKTRQCIEELDSVEADLQGSEDDVRDYLSIFVVHPSWHVAEAATAVLARMIDGDGRLRNIIDKWADSEHWQARYAAADAAFNARECSADDREKFSSTIKRLAKDENKEVQYICAEDLFLAIEATEKYLTHANFETATQSPAKLADEFHDQLRYWLETADDCTLLDELFSFFHKAMKSTECYYAKKRETFQEFVDGPVSDYLKVPDEPDCDKWWAWDWEDWVRAMDRWRRKHPPTTPGGAQAQSSAIAG